MNGYSVLHEQGDVVPIVYTPHDGRIKLKVDLLNGERKLRAPVPVV